MWGDKRFEYAPLLGQAITLRLSGNVTPRAQTSAVRCEPAN